MKTLATTLAVLFVAIGHAAAADATGKWEATISGPRGEMALVFDLKADGETLSGTVSNDFMGESEISDGKVSGDSISFKQVMERGDRKITFAYSGAVNGNAMELTRTIEGMNGGGVRKGGPRADGPPAGESGGRRGGMGREVTFTAKRIE